MRWRRLGEFWYLVPPLGFVALPADSVGVAARRLLHQRLSARSGAELGRYRDLFADALYRSYLVTTVLFGVVVTAVTLAIGYPLAYFVVRQARRSYTLLLLAVVSPLLVSVVARTVGWIILLGNEGLVNSALLALGIVSKPVQILFTPLAATIGMVHVLLPFMVLSLASVLSRQDRSLEEAALSLGADRHPRLLARDFSALAPRRQRRLRAGVPADDWLICNAGSAWWREDPAAGADGV